MRSQRERCLRRGFQRTGLLPNHSQLGAVRSQGKFKQFYRVRIIARAEFIQKLTSSRGNKKVLVAPGSSTGEQTITWNAAPQWDVGTLKCNAAEWSEMTKSNGV